MMFHKHFYEQVLKAYNNKPKWEFASFILGKVDLICKCGSRKTGILKTRQMTWERDRHSAKLPEMYIEYLKDETTSKELMNVDFKRITYTLKEHDELIQTEI